jgi:hypothetical protein
MEIETCGMLNCCVDDIIIHSQLKIIERMKKYRSLGMVDSVPWVVLGDQFAVG